MRPKLQSQQILLKFIGFYHGKCDGIWGPDSIAAMRKFEADSSFNPGYPSHGMPFKDRGQLPHKVYRVPGTNGHISHIDMPDGYAKEHKDALVTESKSRELLGNTDTAKVELKPTVEEVKVDNREARIQAQETIQASTANKEVDPVRPMNSNSNNKHHKHNK